MLKTALFILQAFFWMTHCLGHLFCSTLENLLENITNGNANSCQICTMVTDTPSTPQGVLTIRSSTWSVRSGFLIQRKTKKIQCLSKNLKEAEIKRRQIDKMVRKGRPRYKLFFCACIEFSFTSEMTTDHIWSVTLFLRIVASIPALMQHYSEYKELDLLSQELGLLSYKGS